MNGVYIEKKNGSSAGKVSQNPSVVRAVIYCRLSKDDEQEGDSVSIQNQRAMLEHYCKSQGWEITAVYQDDGYTGLNMNRPDLQRMLQAVELKQIDAIVTKDSSRLSRNYLEAGHLMEVFFPKHGVRYIAVNDNLDTESGNTDIAPFRNVLNQMYSQDVSKKVHSGYLAKAHKGHFTGCVAPFGYKKSAEDRNRLEPDEDTAWIVKAIFDYAREGKGPNAIRRRLEEAEIPCPAWWNRQKGYRNHTTKFEIENPETGRFIWDFTTIKEILQNPVYIGAIASQKQVYRFKTGWLRDKKPDEWLVVGNMHEPIISPEVFEIVQEKVKNRQRTDAFGNYSLFAGLIRCGQCGYPMTIRRANQRGNLQIYTCSRYNKYGKTHCTQHRTDYDRLYNVVLDQIRHQARLALADEAEVSARLSQTLGQEDCNEQLYVEKSIVDDTARLDTLDRLIAKLYEDMVSNKISADNFNTLLEKSQSEQEALKNRIANNKARLDTQEQEQEDITRFRAIIREYTDIQELDGTILNHLINKIVVHEYVDDGKRLRQTVEIHFNFTNPQEKCRVTWEQIAVNT